MDLSLGETPQRRQAQNWIEAVGQKRRLVSPRERRKVAAEHGGDKEASSSMAARGVAAQAEKAGKRWRGRWWRAAMMAASAASRTSRLPSPLPPPFFRLRCQLLPHAPQFLTCGPRRLDHRFELRCLATASIEAAGHWALGQAPRRRPCVVRRCSWIFGEK